MSDFPSIHRITTLTVITLAWVTPFITPENRADAGQIPIRSESELPQILTGEPFHQALKTRIPGVTWNGTPLRQVIREFAETSKLSIIRDRRIDPTKTVTLSLNNQTRREILSAIAQSVDAEIRIVGHVIYLGPPAAAKPLRTLAALRTFELSNVYELSTANQSRGGHALLRERRTVQWGDLSEPREIIEQIGEEFDLKIINPEAIPHDLWEGGTLPEMTAVEMLTVVSIQFDLTFAWEGFRTIRLVPLPESREEIAYTRTYRIPPDKQQAFEAWLRTAEDVSITEGRPQHVFLWGLLEKHEELKYLLYHETPEKSDPKLMVAPLERRRFTLTVTGVPAQAIMNQLEASGITFEYDAAALKKSDVDFATPVTMDLKAASPETFLAAIFDPLGLDFEFSGTNVRLSLKD